MAQVYARSGQSVQSGGFIGVASSDSRSGTLTLYTKFHAEKNGEHQDVHLQVWQDGNFIDLGPHGSNRDFSAADLVWNPSFDVPPRTTITWLANYARAGATRNEAFTMQYSFETAERLIPSEDTGQGSLVNGTNQNGKYVALVNADARFGRVKVTAKYTGEKNSDYPDAQFWIDLNKSRIAKKEGYNQGIIVLEYAESFVAPPYSRFLFELGWVGARVRNETVSLVAEFVPD